MKGLIDEIPHPETMIRRIFIKRAITTGILLSSAGTILQSCAGDGTGGSSSLNFANWASAETATRNQIDKALNAFESQHNVQVNNIGMPFDDSLTQLTAMTKAGIHPDVMELSGNWPYALASTGALADLAPFVSQQWRKDGFPNSFEAGTYKGTLYAVPFSITPHGFWYSKKLMAAAGLSATLPPRTINDLNQAMEVLRAKLPDQVYPIGIDTSKTEYALVGFWPWIWTFGGNPMSDDGKGNVTINWADNGTIAAFQWLQDAVRKRWTPLGLAIKAEREMMAFDKLVFKLDGPYLTGQLGDINPSLNTTQKVNNQFAVTTTPIGPGASKAVTCADIHNLGMSAYASNKELAWKLVDFLTTSKEVILSFLIPEGGVLPYRSFNTDTNHYASYYADAIYRTFITSIIPTMRPPAFGPHYSVAAAAVVSALQEIASGASVKPRLTRLTDEVQAIYR
jgi:multiple sugar transport system substrate-binding protein